MKMSRLFLFTLLMLNISYSKDIIGKFERINLKEFGLYNIRAKIDTGAKTSSLHCSFIHELSDNYVAFILLDEDHKKFIPASKIAKISRTAKVKSSNGKIQKRYFVKTVITILGKEYLTEFSLTDRGSMRFPVLIGRSLLKKNFCVDVTKKYIGEKKDKLP